MVVLVVVLVEVLVVVLEVVPEAHHKLEAELHEVEVVLQLPEAVLEVRVLFFRYASNTTIDV